MTNARVERGRSANLEAGRSHECQDGAARPPLDKQTLQLLIVRQLTGWTYAEPAFYPPTP